VAVNSAAISLYSFSVSVPAGAHTIAIAFTNDAMVGSEDRNLYIDKLIVAGQ